MEHELTYPPVLERARRGRPRRARGGARRPAHPVVGKIAAVGEAGEVLVQLPGTQSAGPLPARSVVPVGPGDVGRDAVLAFERGSRRRPLVMGLVQGPAVAPAASAAPAIKATVDGQTLEFTAEREIVLRCGRASITLTRAGKVLIRGAYVLSRSSGANRIKGGSVQIN